MFERLKHRNAIERKQADDIFLKSNAAERKVGARVF
jgi:hypothetical protein